MLSAIGATLEKIRGFISASRLQLSYTRTTCPGEFESKKRSVVDQEIG